MADNKDENDKKGGIVKIAIFAAAGLVLLGIGLGIGALIFGGGSEPDPNINAPIPKPIPNRTNPAAAKIAISTMPPFFSFSSLLSAIRKLHFIIKP